MRDSTTRRLGRASLVVLLGAMPAATQAQSADSVPPPRSNHYWPTLAAGAVTSVLLHEAAHIATAIAVGGHPTFGFDELRPTVYSGLNSRIEPHKQFLFSVAGLGVQNVLDEAILDLPHHRGSAFERGLLAGGLGTTIFYLTIGRWGSVSDVDFIARTHAMTKTQTTLLFGSVVAEHVIRIRRDDHYADFFVEPRASGNLELGVRIGPGR